MVCKLLVRYEPAPGFFLTPELFEDLFFSLIYSSRKRSSVSRKQIKLRLNVFHNGSIFTLRGGQCFQLIPPFCFFFHSGGGSMFSINTSLLFFSSIQKYEEKICFRCSTDSWTVFTNEPSKQISCVKLYLFYVWCSKCWTGGIYFFWNNFRCAWVEGIQIV